MSKVRAIIDPNVTNKLSKEKLELRNKIINNSFKMAFREDEKLKKLYNKTLQRYYNGCNYIEEHTEEIDKYLPAVKKLLNNLNEILKKIPNATEEEILNGFKT